MKNHLGMESSPYLLQHAENPVDWHPWNEEAFGKASALISLYWLFYLPLVPCYGVRIL